MANKHPLPLFPPGVDTAFYSLCAELSIDETFKLREQVQSSYDSFLQMAESKPLLDTVGAKQIYDVCNYLLDVYSDTNNRGKALIIGAIRYCVIDQDVFDDTVYVTGLFDDKRVINYVLDELGIKDKFIDVF